MNSSSGLGRHMNFASGLGGHMNFASGLGGIGILHAKNLVQYPPRQMEIDRPLTFFSNYNFLSFQIGC